MASISILALYNYDPTIFDQLVLPDSLDKTDLVNNLLLEFAGIEVLYPDPNLMKDAIGAWSRMRLHTWKRFEDVLYENYDPFINIKRDEVRTITQDRDLQSSGTTTGKVSAWNESSFTNRDQQDGISSDTGTVTTTETFHVEGDSAITDAQDVLRKEMEVRIKYDLDCLILDEFKRRFLIMVY